MFCLGFFSSFFSFYKKSLFFLPTLLSFLCFLAFLFISSSSILLSFASLFSPLPLFLLQSGAELEYHW